ncbi:MAG: hypothetical protein KUG82_21245 [Pseudomonadales bacterium]|nr:hypothetical protein [Pseudomonadales bacterium]
MNSQSLARRQQSFLVVPSPMFPKSERALCERLSLVPVKTIYTLHAKIGFMGMRVDKRLIACKSYSEGVLGWHHWGLLGSVKNIISVKMTVISFRYFFQFSLRNS